jgi:hypothetical protein
MFSLDWVNEECNIFACGCLELEKFTSPHFKHEFNVAGFLCVHILKQTFPSVLVGT